LLPVEADQDLRQAEAMRIYLHAQKLMSEDKLDQAIKEFQTVASTFSKTDIADEAFLEIAHCWTKKGHFNWAVDNLQTIISEYPSSNSAPEASFRLGELYENRAFQDFSLEESYGNFARVFDVYPDSPRANEALLRAGNSLALQGQWLEAVPLFRRLLFQSAGSRFSSDGWLFLGQSLALTGHPLDAMKAIQRVGGQHHEGASFTRVRAQGWNTQLYRFHVIPHSMGLRPMSLALDPIPRRAAVMAFDPNGKLLLVDNERKALVVYSREGKQEKLHALPNPGRALSVDPLGGWLVACGSCVVQDGRSIRFRPTTSDKYIEPKDLKRISLATIQANGNLFLGVSGGKGLYRFDTQRNVLDSSFPPNVPGKILDVTLDPTGRICLLFSQGRGLLARYDLNGKKIDQVHGSALKSKRLTRLTVSPLGYFYLLDGRSQEVLILGSSLDLISRISLHDLGIHKGSQLAVHPDGTLHVLDSRTGKIFRLE